MLSFAVGGLLGDVFLHLLPEAWSFVHKSGTSPHGAHLLLGIWVVCGISTFVAIEMMFTIGSQKKEEEEGGKKEINCNGNSTHYSSSPSPPPCQGVVEQVKKSNTIQISGYLNLMANGIDNFTHGLAVAASFLVGMKIGILTTLAIIIHEVPHEFGDFAILMKSGFSRWEAMKAQMSTASIGILGCIVALSADSAESIGAKTAWILPFTAGGFIHIALISILPDILKEDNAWESIKQLICLASGIAVMALVNCL
jgi:zinc transporter 13